MKKNDIRELHNKSESELSSQIQQLRSELAKVNVTSAQKRGTNVRRSSILNDDLARVLTILREKEMKK